MAITLGADPAEINLNVIKGSTFRKIITVEVGPDENNTTPVDYTGATAEMHIRDPNDSSVLLHTMSTANGGIILGDATGTITFFISNTDSSSFDWEEGEYESLEITYPSGDVEGFSFGMVFIGRELTL
jgi:hypothetical protein